jgi:succinyl-CoA synthetase beta subunit
MGLHSDLAEKISRKLGFSGKNFILAKEILLKLWEIVVDLEAQLVEINPLAMTLSGLIALDGKIILDEDSAFRQPLVEKLQEKKLSELEKFAKTAGFSFVELNGEIGILANGAGLTMALIDVLSNLRLKPANFLDVGGGASNERVYKALELLLKMNPKVILVNIFGGITRCDIVAEAIIEALQNFQNTPPMVIRLTGTNEEEGIKMLKEKNINVYTNIMEAVKRVKEVLAK